MAVQDKNTKQQEPLATCQCASSFFPVLSLRRQRKAILAKKLGHGCKTVGARNTLEYQGQHIKVRITLLTGEEGKKGKINFRLGIEPGTQRLGVQCTKYQAITQDKSISPFFPGAECTGLQSSHNDCPDEVYLSFLSFLTCQQSNSYHTISRWTEISICSTPKNVALNKPCFSMDCAVECVK